LSIFARKRPLFDLFGLSCLFGKPDQTNKLNKPGKLVSALLGIAAPL
jgi:hypothetical protein